jgi:hypothetical protein
MSSIRAQLPQNPLGSPAEVGSSASSSPSSLGLDRTQLHHEAQRGFTAESWSSEPLHPSKWLSGTPLERSVARKPPE